MNTSSVVDFLDENEPARFHWADYLVFFTILGISSALGLYYGVAARSKTTEDFLMAGRNMPFLPVSLSLFVSWLSAISVVGDPVEVYLYGSVYWLIMVGYSLALPLVAHVFAPVYYRAQLTSAYQYLKERYHVHVRTFGSIVNGIGTATYLGIALYAPCLALSQMSGLDTFYSILLVGGVCMFYTSLGGMKAVLWADAIQAVVMLVGLLALVVLGGSAAGGPKKIYQVASESGRINFNRFDIDPTRRATFWTYLIGGFFRVLNPYISVQLWIQRYCTVKNERSLKIAIYLNILYFAVFITLFTLVGMVLTAYYSECDPMLSGKIKKRDQMVPLLVMETLSFLPGVPGLLLACIISASLSTISSGQSGLAATCLKDFVEPIYHKVKGTRLSPKAGIVLAVVLSVLFGVVNIILAWCIYALKSTVFSLTLTITGAFTGPIAGIFFLGVLVAATTTFSAMLSCAASLGIVMWLALGSFLNRPPPNPLDILPISECLVTTNYTESNGFMSTSAQPFEGVTNFTTTSDPASGFSINQLYAISPALFHALGFLITVILGLVTILFQRLLRRCNFNKSDELAGNSQELEHFRKTY